MEDLIAAFMEKDNCERIGIMAGTIETLLEKFSKGECTEKELFTFYEELFKANEREIFYAPDMDCANCYDFDCYFRLLNEVVSKNITVENLIEELQLCKKAKAQYTIIDHLRGPLNNLDLKPSSFKMENCIYFDSNIYDSIEKERILSLVKDLNVVYSPIHLEEVYRMDDNTYIALRKNTITEVTDNNLIIQMQDVFEIHIQDPEKIYERVLDNLELSDALEQDRLIKADDRNIFFKEIYEKYRQHLHFMDDVFNTVSWEDIGKMLFFGGCFLSKEDFKVEKNKTTPDEIRHRIYSLYNMLDNLSFFRDRNKKGRAFKSAVYDIEHLRYAANCRYFVTKDENLAARAKQIFRFMDIATEVIYISKTYSLQTFIQGLEGKD